MAARFSLFGGYMRRLFGLELEADPAEATPTSTPQQAEAKEGRRATVGNQDPGQGRQVPGSAPPVLRQRQVVRQLFGPESCSVCSGTGLKNKNDPDMVWIDGFYERMKAVQGQGQGAGGGAHAAVATPVQPVPAAVLVFAAGGQGTPTTPALAPAPSPRSRLERTTERKRESQRMAGIRTYSDEVPTVTPGLRVFPSTSGKKYMASYHGHLYHHKDTNFTKQTHRFRCSRRDSDCKATLFLSLDYDEVVAVGNHSHIENGDKVLAVYATWMCRNEAFKNNVQTTQIYDLVLQRLNVGPMAKALMPSEERLKGEMLRIKREQRQEEGEPDVDSDARRRKRRVGRGRRSGSTVTTF